MKRYIKCNSFNGYLYIFKHGIGPGAIPKDVTVIKEKSLPNGYTAVWLDRFLTTSELKQYDIPSETQINKYLGSINYCQKNGDVVPCETVTAAKSNKAAILDTYVGKDIWLKAKLSEKAYFRRGYTGNEYWIRIVDKDEAGKYVINRVSSYKEYKGNSAQKQRTLSNTYTVDKNSITLFNPIQTATTEEIFNVEACDEVLASSYIKSAREPKWWGSTYSCKVIDAYNKGKLTYKNMEEWETEYNGGFKPSNMGTKEILDYYIKTGKDPRDDIEACDKVTASAATSGYTNKIVASKMSDIDLLAREALECTTKDELAAVISGLDSLGLRKLFLHYMEMLKDPSLSVPYIASQLSDELICQYSDKDVNACGKVTAASGIFYIDKGAGIGNINELFTEDDLRAAFNSLLAEGDPIATSYDSFDSWVDATLDSGLLNVEFFDEDVEDFDDEFDETDIDATTHPKYFANMVNASDDPDSYHYLVRGYYDRDRKGLAADSVADTLSEADEIINEYANQGYYIELRNMKTGTILEFSADNWFDEIYPDGGFAEIGDF